MTEEVPVQEDGDLGIPLALGRQVWSSPPLSLLVFARGPEVGAVLRRQGQHQRSVLPVTYEEGRGTLLSVVWGVAPSTPQVLPVMTELTCKCTDVLWQGGPHADDAGHMWLGTYL